MALETVRVRVTAARATRVVLAIVAFGSAMAAHPSDARGTRRGPVAELLINASSGRVIFASLPDAPHRPASLTKMMTLYLLFDALDSGRVRLSESIPVSFNAARQPASRLGLTAGTTLPLRTAIQAMAVHSANDVSVAIAERLGGSEAAFAAMMSAKARQLGMTRTSFANATGLTNTGIQTTARDMATLARALLRDHPREYPVFATRAITWRARRYVNYDHLLGKVGGVDGIKTGYTADAGYNIATSAKRSGVRVISRISSRCPRALPQVGPAPMSAGGLDQKASHDVLLMILADRTMRATKAGPNNRGALWLHGFRAAACAPRR